MIGERKLWERPPEEWPPFAREVLGAFCHAELAELMRQAGKAADLVCKGEMSKADAAEWLWAACFERQLPISYGPDLIQQIIGGAFKDREAR